MGLRDASASKKNLHGTRRANQSSEQERIDTNGNEGHMAPYRCYHRHLRPISAPSPKTLTHPVLVIKKVKFEPHNKISLRICLNSVEVLKIMVLAS